MRKIMIALAAVAMAAVSQAAVVQWKSGALTDGTGAAVKAANKITAYVWAIDAATYSTYAAMDGASLSQTIGAAFAAGELASAEASKANTYSSRGGAAADVLGTSTYSAGDTAYGLVLYVDAANDMYMANAATVTFSLNANASIGELATKLGGTNDNRGATAWAAAAVPEPTSGLLLLLGMAGLALKRKHA